jgi:hypothetical protein
MKGNKHIQSFNEHQENLNISDVSDSNYTPIKDLEYDIETRPYGDPNGKIYICLFHERHFRDDYFDDHNTIYKIDNDKFYQEFKKLPYMKGGYNNEYAPIRFKTEEECNIFLNSIGLKRV